jgi:hypothetical protein
LSRHSRISALRIPLEDCGGEHPNRILQPEKPSEAVCRAWIPVPIGEQVWVLYEFPNVASRRVWEEQVPEQIRRWLDRGVIAPALRYGSRLWRQKDWNT